MAYTTPEFWLFLLAMLAGVALLPVAARAGWLIAASLLFYAAPDPWRLLWLGGVALAALAAMRAEGPPARALRWGCIMALVALLVWAKFPDALRLPDPGAPPGLSFIVFTAIALIAEAMRRGARWPLPATLLHLVWFPKLLAGPIERPQDLVPQLGRIALRPSLAALGLGFVLSGLIKKLVVADTLAPMVDAAFALPGHAPPLDLLFACYLFAFQIYGDFSGYADIAIGLSALVGLRLSANFDRPYLAVTVGEFWAARWHITLGRWFRDFVYFPLGGSRAGRGRQIANLMLVFLLSGLWHAGLGYGVGWGFVIWGALNGAFVTAETLLPAPRRPIPRLLRGLLTFHLIVLSWVFFRAATPGDALTILTRIAGALPELPLMIARYPFTAEHGLALALIAALMLADALQGPRPWAERLSVAPLALRWGAAYAGFAVLVILGRWSGAGFIYAGF